MIETFKMEDNSTVIGTYVFRGVEYIVTMKIENGNSLLVEVEDRLTADQWRGTFDQACKYHLYLTPSYFLSFSFTLRCE